MSVIDLSMHFERARRVRRLVECELFVVRHETTEDPETFAKAEAAFGEALMTTNAAIVTDSSLLDEAYLEVERAGLSGDQVADAFGRFRERLLAAARSRAKAGA